MNSASDSNDPHGYGRLHRFLLDVEKQLAADGYDAESMRVHQASRFYGGGSPSEFLGESRLALLATLNAAPSLPNEFAQRIENVVAEIDEGFQAVGGG
jgi:hypothetical protein